MTFYAFPVQKMDTPCVLITSCGDNPVENLIKDILNVEALPQSKPEVEEIVSYGWSIDTKYYTADIKLCLTKRRTIGDRDFADSVQAFIVFFDADKNDTFTAVKLWNSYLKEIEPEIKMLVCDRCLENSAIGRLEAQTWCIENGFELVELNPEILSDSETEDDFVETTGTKRIIQSLHAHTWPNMDLKDNKHSMSPFIRQLMKEEHEEQKQSNADGISEQSDASGVSESNVDNVTEVCACMKDKKNQLNEKELSENKAKADEKSNACEKCGLVCEVETEGACGNTEHDRKSKKSKDYQPSKEARLDSMLPADDMALFEALGNDDPGGESFEKLFEKFAQLKEKANNLPMTERKKYAENVAIAFWKAIGGDDDEIDDLDL